MFEAAARRLSGRDKRAMVMIGDQLATDILGANNFGIDSVLVLTGLGRASEIACAPARPTYVLPICAAIARRETGLGAAKP